MLVIISVILAFTNKKVNKIKAIIYSLAFLMTFFVLVPVIKSYALNPRVLMIYYVMFFIVGAKQLYDHDGSFLLILGDKLKKLSWLFVLLLAIQLYLIISNYMVIYKFEQFRKDLIMRYHAQDIVNPVLPCLSYFGPNIFLDDITSNKKYYNNEAFAEFYDFKSVKCANNL